MVPLVHLASQIGVQRVIVTHVDHGPTIVPLDVQLELAQLGCSLERCYAGLLIGPTAASERLRSREPATWAHITDGIRAVGVEQSIISTDLGAIELIDPLDGMAAFLERLSRDGFSASQIDRLVERNSRHLLEP